MNVRFRKPSDWPAECSIKDIKERLTQIIESDLYVYPKKPITELKYAAIIEKDKAEFKGTTKEPNFFIDIKEAFIETTVLIGACRKVGKYITEFRIYDVLWYEGVDLTKEPLIRRIPYIKKAVDKINNSSVVGAEYINVSDRFYNTLGKFFSLGGQKMTIFNKLESYPGSNSSTKIIDKRIFSIIDGEVIDYIESKKDDIPNQLDSWRYWQNKRTGEKLCGEFFKDYIYDNLILEPISEDYFYNRSSGVIIKLFDGRQIKLSNNKLRKGEKIKIGCVDFNNTIYHPHLMED